MNERQMIKFFEGIEPPEGVRAELLRGEILLSRSPDLVHNRTVMEMVDQIPRERWSGLQTQCVDMLDGVSAPVPDLVVTRRGAGPNQGTYMPSAAVTALVEVVSRTSVDRDHGVKRSIYAASGVPAYLIIDPIMAQCVLLTEPRGDGEEADYQVRRTSAFGYPVPMEHLGIELSTTELGAYGDIKPHRWS